MLPSLGTFYDPCRVSVDLSIPIVGLQNLRSACRVSTVCATWIHLPSSDEAQESLFLSPYLYPCRVTAAFSVSFSALLQGPFFTGSQTLLHRFRQSLFVLPGSFSEMVFQFFKRPWLATIELLVMKVELRTLRSGELHWSSTPQRSTWSSS